MAHDLSSLGLDDETRMRLLHSPQTFLAQASPESAEQMRSVLVPAYRRGFRVVFIVGASLAAVAFVLALVLMPQVELSRPDDGQLKEAGRKMDEERRLVVTEKKTAVA